MSEVASLSLKLWRLLGDECDAAPAANYEEDDYNAGFVAGLARAQVVIREKLPTLAAGYRKAEPVAETRTEWGVRRAPKYGCTVAWMDSRADAESLAQSWEDALVVSRTVTAGHWTEEPR